MSSQLQNSESVLIKTDIKNKMCSLLSKFFNLIIPPCAYLAVIFKYYLNKLNFQWSAGHKKMIS